MDTFNAIGIAEGFIPCEDEEEVIKLNNILINDFGITKKEISIFFSGNKGYHLVVESQVYEKLDKRDRREIVNYVLAKDLDLRYLGFDKKTSFQNLISRLPAATDPGWGGRIIQFFEGYDTPEELVYSNTSEKVARIYNSKSIKFNISISNPNLIITTLIVALIVIIERCFI